MDKQVFRGENDRMKKKRQMPSNIIIGHLIPAGTGMYRYQDVEMDIEVPEGFEPLPAAVEPPLAALPTLAESLSQFGDE